ncbi:MAG: recombination mediator RecR [Fimbriimonadaceae bacterium]|nr:recombination mediator RecR [Fimbriimonadaceae bacterium]QYK54684.1 MAG: recombination mediator RecR [Fimbriimonadaceae bacterium]
MHFARPLAELISRLERLPGVGPKSAQRLAYHTLKMPTDDVRSLANALVAARESLRFCEVCQDFSSEETCRICSDPRRDPRMICVVGEPRDVAAMERLNEYKGTYHVLHGLLSPMDGIGPEQIRVRELLERLRAEIDEVILATNPTVEGDTTALYLAKLMKPLGVTVTRLAHGMPVGGELDYADTATLLSAFEYRRPI